MTLFHRSKAVDEEFGGSGNHLHASNPQCTDTVEMLLDNEEVLSPNEKKVLLYIHRWNKNHFEPLKIKIHDHLETSEEYFSKFENHIAGEEELRKQFNRIETLLWTVGVVISGVSLILGIRLW